MLRTLTIAAILVLAACHTAPIEPKLLSIDKTAFGVNGGLASAHPVATQIGLDILKKGGNAIDAAIATQFALAVCYPVAGNIGGGGFMVIRMADGTVDALDFREMGPGLASRDMYLDEEGNVIPGLSISGHLASGVPGAVDGMVKAFNKYSKLKDWASLVQPSVDIAAYGVVLTEREARGLNTNKENFIKYNTVTPRFIKDTEWQTGDILKQPELSRTLESIRDNMSAGFYTGWVADSIVAEMQRGGGIISLEDLKNYQAIWRKPLVADYKGYTIISMPPSSSGGIALQQLLSSIEDFNIAEYGFLSGKAVHLMVEAERRVYADRATHLGDADFYPVPIGQLIADEYNRQRMKTFHPNKATRSTDVAAGEISIKESEQTTHFSIVDGEGNAVSLTTTINTGYGSKVVVGGTGFLLNNEMDDFSSKPGTPNFFGLIGNEANSIAPRKRMLSSMTPTIIAKDNDLLMVVGTPGGSTIITQVFQVIVNVLEFDMTITEALAACRFHHQWLPDQIMVEKDCIDTLVRQSLSEMGHTIVERGTIGRVEAILKLPDGRYEVAADPRGDDAAMAY